MTINKKDLEKMDFSDVATGERLPPVHPGEVLNEDFLKPMGISQSRLASDLGISFRRINEIVQGKRSITAVTALLLGKYFGMSPSFWMNLQTAYDLEKAEQESQEELARVRPAITMIADAAKANCFSLGTVGGNRTLKPSGSQSE